MKDRMKKKINLSVGWLFNFSFNFSKMGKLNQMDNLNKTIIIIFMQMMFQLLSLLACFFSGKIIKSTLNESFHLF